MASRSFARIFNLKFKPFLVCNQRNLRTGTAVTVGSGAFIFSYNRNQINQATVLCEEAKALSTTSPSPANNNNNNSSRTIIHDIKPIPSDAPASLINLTKDPQWIYRDVKRVYDVSDHLLFSSLVGMEGIQNFFYFVKFNDNEDHQNDEKNNQPPIQHHNALQLIDNKNNDNNSKFPEIKAFFRLGNKLCGHKGIIHGGFSAAVIDELCGAATYAAIGGGNFTARLEVDYLAPVFADKWVEVTSTVESIQGRKAYVRCSIADASTGAVYVKGRALFIIPKIPISALVASVQ